jgi:hypothetical protein
MLKRREARRLARSGAAAAEIDRLLHEAEERTTPNWWILGGSAVFVATHHQRRAVGIEYGQEIIFVTSFAIIGFMISRLLRELSPEAARTLLGTVIVIFVFRAMPGPGAGRAGG